MEEVEGNPHLFVISHKNIWFPNAECISPLRADQKAGLHISDKENYSELRAHYWVWRNESFFDDDHVGFFHYRRYLDLNPGAVSQYPVNKKRPRPYFIKKSPDPEKYSMENVRRAINEFDVIAPLWEYTGLRVWKRYGQSAGHHIEDLKLVYQILLEKYPSYRIAADTYLNGQGEYYGNIYIMRWRFFKKYCTWLFDILNEFDLRKTVQSNRVDGYLGERLFGIYFTWLLMQGTFSCGECPRIHYSCYDDALHHMSLNTVCNVFLPPGSKARGLARRITSTFVKRNVDFR